MYASMKKIIYLLLIIFGLPSVLHAKVSEPEKIWTYYQNRYPLKDPYAKLVDNHGKGVANLYGVRNFRSVLNGVVYRGGANNLYNKNGKRPNHNPLPEEGLQNLCTEGFGTAIYLYSTNFKKAPGEVHCESVLKRPQTLQYVQKTPHLYQKDVRHILNLVHTKLTTDKDPSPIYLHCWNGWHASGLMSALVLRQFCDYSAAKAVKYWDRNTDGVNKNPRYERFRAKIRSFQPDPNLKIDAEIKSRVCPK